MTDLICICNDRSELNPFFWACSYLERTHGARIIGGSPEEWKQIVSRERVKVVLANTWQALSLAQFSNLAIYLTDFTEPDLAMKRQITLHAKNIDIYSASSYIAGRLNQIRIKSRIQHPVLPDNKSTENRIVCSMPIANILRNELPYEDIVDYENPNSLSSAKIYIHSANNYTEAYSKLLLAISYGVPVVCEDVWNMSEFASGGITLIPPGTDHNKWIYGVKTALRDRETQINMVDEIKRRYSNLDAIVDKLKRSLPRLPVAPPRIVPVPPTREQLIQKRVSERAAQVLARRQQHQPKSIPVPEREPPPIQFGGFKRSEYVPPTTPIISTPTWFNTTGEIDVSIIVPLFNSASVIEQQIRNWDISDDGIRKEIIYVSDACPQNSADAVMKSWSDMKTNHDRSRDYYPNGFTYKVGKIVSLSHHSGFATACNKGAEQATGKYLLFLNADCIVTPNWVKPMVDLMEQDSNIGIVGNMQLKQDGSIDSAGSMWMSDSKSFDHIGRNVYNGKRLTKTMHLTNCPDELLIPAEREMVTGCCFMIRKSLFDEIKGFDVNYRIAYWEDADLNMEVKSRGYKVFFQPNSIVYHQVAHSGASNHPYMIDNAKLFHSKWSSKLKELLK